MSTDTKMYKTDLEVAHQEGLEDADIDEEVVSALTDAIKGDAWTLRGHALLILACIKKLGYVRPKKT